MAVTAEQIAQVRRMTNEPTTEVYSDAAITSLIAAYPITDELGVDPYYWDYSNGTPVKTTTEGWIETYNLNAAAADIWQEKAAKVAEYFDFSADGGNYSRSQAYNQYMQMAAFYRKRAGVSTIKQIKKPDETQNAVWIGNLRETD